MTAVDLDHLLREAATPTLRRIEADAGAATAAQVKRLLAHLGYHLFDPDLTAIRLRRRLGLTTDTLVAFASQTHFTIAVYIEIGRLETAMALLRATSLPVNVVGELVGYQNLETFRRVFKRWLGIVPQDFRPYCLEAIRRWGPEVVAEIQTVAFFNRLAVTSPDSEEARRLRAIVAADRATGEPGPHLRADLDLATGSRLLLEALRRTIEGATKNQCPN